VCEDKTAVIISAGTELTEGIIQDTHVRYLASELTSLGFSVRRASQIPDEASLFRDELFAAIRNACLVIITGGLGPTTDDLTRETVAEAAGVPLVFHQEAWDALLARFVGRPVAESNRKQALAPQGFALLPNPNGTAPGFQGTLGDALVVALPGPPSELRPMFSASVVPLLRERFGAPGEEDMLWGTALMVPESVLEQELRASRRPDVTWGTRVEDDRISFSLRGGAAADRVGAFSDLQSKLGDVRIRKGDTRPSLLLTDALLARGAMLVTAESCTGGLIAKYMTDLPGSSRVVWGSFIAYSNEAKIRCVGVSRDALEKHGAVSEETVGAMAIGAVAASGALVGIAVSGVAGPDGGTPEKPVGTVWIAVALGVQDCATTSFQFSGSRDMIRRRTAVAAMLFAEARLRGTNFLDSRAKW
jgi:nicotinamide-nucleotide amidase